MAKYNGTTELISGLIQANNQNFPLVDASAVQVDDNGKRLDEALDQINERLNSGINTYVDEEELSAMLTEILI
jgi:hypothetical protein